MKNENEIKIEDNFGREVSESYKRHLKIQKSIKAKMAAERFSQEMIAELLGITQSGVSKVLTRNKIVDGVIEPAVSLDRIIGMAETLGFKVDIVITNDNDDFIEDYKSKFDY